MRKGNAGKRVALCSFLCALGVIVLLFGGVFSVAMLFCAPALAMALLIVAEQEFGTGTGVMLYTATAFLGLLLVPDKEVALLYVFIGYYPLVKKYIDRLRLRIIRVGLKLILFNCAIGLMYGLMIFLFGLQEVTAEYQATSAWILAVLCVLGNISFFLYDALLVRLQMLYRLRIRRHFFKE